MQSPSFLAHQNYLNEERGMNNARTIFGIEKISSDNQLRYILDPISPNYFAPVYLSLVQWLQERRKIEEFRSVNGNILIPLDGTGFFSSHEIYCSQCSVKEHKDGSRTYAHSAITPAIVGIGKAQVIPLPQEFITPQDGHDKRGL
jgi:hypothetical protein